jgi:beta-lactamase superfamily II metal-dependent hydrolase
VKLQSAIERWGWSWNQEFKERVASVDSKSAGLGIPLDDGLTIWMLSPNDRQLVSFLPRWSEAFARMKPDKEARTDEFESFGITSIDVEALAREAYSRDSSLPNGTSIAYIAEYQGKRVMLAADAHSEVLVDGLKRLGATEDNPYKLDLLKVSHHGSRANTSPEFLRLINCKRFAISTNGERHDHPDRQTIARILSRPSGPNETKTLYFNFDQTNTRVWHHQGLEEHWKYGCVFLNGQAISI